MTNRKMRYSLISALVTFFLAAGIWSKTAHAYPGMIRHGYVNCTSCHVQSTGGGVLTAYGRGLSEELLSFKSYEKEGRLIYNTLGVADRLPEKQVQVGGDVRVIQTYKDNPLVKEERFFLMQADLEGAVELGQFTMDANFGYYDGIANSLRHYVSYRFAEDVALRFGRFRPAYGINTPEHTTVIKRNLGWDESSETYNLELALLKSDWNLYLTGLFGKFESVSTDDGLSFGTTGIAEKGAAARASYFLNEHYEFGMEYYFGNNASGSRHVMGPFAVLGFSPQLYLLSELDFQLNRRNLSDPSVTSINGLFHYQKLSYEPVQGWHLIATTELSRSDFNNPRTLLERYGMGVEIYPRPHWEIQAIWHKQHQASISTGFSDLAWLMVHFYL